MMKELLKTKKGKWLFGGIYAAIIVIGCILLNPFSQETREVTTKVTQVAKMDTSTSHDETAKDETSQSSGGETVQAIEKGAQTVVAEDSGQTAAQMTQAPQSSEQISVPPIPGLPRPVEPENVVVNPTKKYRATFTIRVDTILNNMDNLNPDKKGLVPANAVLLPRVSVEFSENENVFQVLQRITRQAGIHMDSVFTPMYNSAYVRGIGNLYEFDCGPQSGWMYRVNGIFPNYGASRYILKDGDVVEWHYTCEGLGSDIK